jgi:thiamine-phosphate pyrophosphorylase
LNPATSRPALRGLYAITDEDLIPAARFAQSVELALRGGAAIIQYRDKSGDTNKRLRQAGELRELCTAHGALLIINDDVGLAKSVSADGVHLGVGDTGLYDARDAVGDDSIIGVSCYANFERARLLSLQGADYVAFGAFYTSPTKPDATQAAAALLSEAREKLAVPVCAIGGINGSNAGALIQAGADMVAIISGLFAQPDIEAAARRLSALFPPTT